MKYTLVTVLHGGVPRWRPHHGAEPQAGATPFKVRGAVTHHGAVELAELAPWAGVGGFEPAWWSGMPVLRDPQDGVCGVRQLEELAGQRSSPRPHTAWAFVGSSTTFSKTKAARCSGLQPSDELERGQALKLAAPLCGAGLVLPLAEIELSFALSVVEVVTSVSA